MKEYRSRVFAIAGPMMLCHFLQTLFNVADVMWIGRLGSLELAGVSWASNVLNVLVTLIVGISLGTTAMVSRFIGANDSEQASRVAWHALLIGTVCAIGLAVVGYRYSQPLLTLLGAEELVAQIGADYLTVIFYGSLVMFWMFLLNSILQGAGDVHIPVQATVVATVLNFVLDPFFIFGGLVIPAMGVKGAALATVISRGVGAIICIHALLRRRSKIRLEWGVLGVKWSYFVRLLKLSIPGSIHMFMKAANSLLMIVIVGFFGYRAVAAYGIGYKLFTLAMMPGFGLGAAASVSIGQHLGAKDFKAALKEPLWAAFYNGLIMQAFALLFIVFGRPIVSLFTTDPEVLRSCLLYLQVTTGVYFFVGMGFVLNKALNGAGDNSSNILINLVCLWFLQVPLSLFFAATWKMEEEGIWWAIAVASFLQACSFIVWFLKREWMHRDV